MVDGYQDNDGLLQAIRSVALEPPYGAVLKRLDDLRPAVSARTHPDVSFFLDLWTSDCHILLGDYVLAENTFPLQAIGTRSSANTDCLLSLKLVNRGRISGRDALTLFGPVLTQYGKQHLELIVTYLDVMILAYEDRRSVSLLEQWAASSPSHRYQVFRGSPYGYVASSSHNVTCFSVSLNKEAYQFVRDICRQAENTVRHEHGIPFIGEGWVSETSLYYSICKAFPDLSVIQHASPNWLGRQHLDIYLPELKLAIEYQGRQHDEPVDYFGGIEAFEMVRKRDLRKRKLCARNGVEILYVRPGYSLAELVAKIGELVANSRHSHS